jgi:PKD repeat protein
VQQAKVGYLRVPLAPFVGLLLLAAPLLGESSTAQNPTVTFSSPGTKQVSLQACNASGCNTLVRQVVVLNPMPQILGIASVPPVVLTSQIVVLSAQTAGRPPLTHRWIITGTSGNLTLTGNPVNWSPANPGIGVYLIRLEVENADGLASSLPINVNVLSGLIFADGFESGGLDAWSGSAGAEP